MLAPKKTKFRKTFKGRIHGNAKGGTSLNFGAYGLKAILPSVLRHVKLKRRDGPLRVILSERAVSGFVFFQMFPYLLSQRKSGWEAEKDLLSFGPAVFTQDELCLNLMGCQKSLHGKHLQLAAAKLPIETKFISRETRGIE
jgi:large subunit ribosomal protein L16